MHSDEPTPAVVGDPTQLGASAIADGPAVVDRLISPLLAAALTALRRREVRQMDPATLSRAMGGSLSMAECQSYAADFTAAAARARCTTVNRIAMWCAQIGHESVGPRYMEEIASGTAYEHRRDLGNIHPGDGSKAVVRSSSPAGTTTASSASGPASSVWSTTHGTSGTTPRT